MDRQAIYERVRTFFSQPGAQLSKSRFEDDETGTNCYYRWDPETDGHYADAPLRCGIGCDFPDALYDNGMEGTGVAGLFLDYPAVAAHFEVQVKDAEGQMSRDVFWLGELQGIHDGAANVEEFLQGLDVFAESSGLTVVGA